MKNLIMIATLLVSFQAAAYDILNYRTVRSGNSYQHANCIEAEKSIKKAIDQELENIKNRYNGPEIKFIELSDCQTSDYQGAILHYYTAKIFYKAQ